MGSKLGGPGEFNIFITLFYCSNVLVYVLLMLVEAQRRYTLPWEAYNLTEEQNK